LEIRGAVATFGKKTCFDAGKIRFCHCAAVLQTQVPKLCIDLDLSLLYILTVGTYSKFARKNNFLALGVCFLQPCSSAGRRFAASRSSFCFPSACTYWCKCCQSWVQQRDPRWVHDPNRSWGIGISVGCPCDSVKFPQKHFLPW